MTSPRIEIRPTWMVSRTSGRAVERRWHHLNMDTGALAEAIRNCKVVELAYRPDGSGRTRIVHPHALYRPGRGGLCLDAVQVAGETRSGQLPAWRQFRLMDVNDVRVLDAIFEPAADFDVGSNKYRHGLIAAVPNPSPAP